MMIDFPDFLAFWPLVTRLGEVQILLPAALLAVLALFRRPDARPLAAWWMVFLLIAAALTTLSKIAFIGWGLGWAELNFTGISGHSMFAAAVYPLLLSTLASHYSRQWQQVALGMGVVLAVFIGISRVMVGAHSVSEVIAGLLLGGAASTASLALAGHARAVIGPVMPALVAIWLLTSPSQVPGLATHSLVTKISLVLSGNNTPYTRDDLLAPRRPS
jgi:membrane-associated phospholipid phosphatase